MTTTYTPEVRAKLEGYLSTHDLPKGMGNRESACSVAAINLALTGELTDDIPDCMSEVLGCATISLQDSMPHEMRNSDRYKSWLPTAAGTGRDHETERLAVLMDWMWGTVLPYMQELADGMGFGGEWRKMCEQRTESSAHAAAYSADAARATARAARATARAADVADYAAVSAAAHAAAYSADAARATARAAVSAAARAADAADYSADAARATARATARVGFWRAVDPIGALERMTKIGED